MALGEKLKEFTQTPGGKTILVAVPVALFAVVVVAAALILLKSDAPSEPETTPVASVSNEASETAPAETSEPEEELPGDAEEQDSEGSSETYINKDFEIYETRDPFKPALLVSTARAASSTSTVKPVAGTGTSSTASTAGGTSQSTEVLSLESIDEEAGALYANVKYGSSSYTVSPGDRVGSSSFQLTALNNESASFLYGDDQLTLRVGEEVSK